MGLEDELTRLLEESVEQLMPPVRDIVAEGSRLGRRRRRIRRGLQAAGAVLAVGAVVTAGTVLAPGFGGLRAVQAAGTASGPVTGGTGAAASATASTPSSQSPSPSPTPTEPMVDMTWQAMLKIFADQLPPGGRLTNLDPFAVKYNNNNGEHYVELQYDDGQGLSTVMVEFSHGSSGTAGGLMSCGGWVGGSDEGPRKPGNEKPMCRTTPLPDGSLMMSYITGTDVVGLYDQAVKLRRADGDFVSITAANATLDQYTGKAGVPITVTRDRPPLGLAGWEAIVRSPLWQAKIPQSTAEAAVSFAKTVKRFPCPIDAKAADCVID